jgi:hypothetical protein
LLDAYASPNHRLRDAILKAASFELIEPTYWMQGVAPFRIQLPTEAILLPHLLFALSRKNKIAKRKVVSLRKELAEIAKIIGGDCGEFKKTMSDSTLSNSTRLAAAVFYDICMNTPAINDAAASQVLAALTENTPAEVYSFVFFWIEETKSEQESSVAEFLERVIDRSRENYPAQLRLQRVLATWRERSSAPITTSGKTIFNDFVGAKLIG